MELKRVKIKDRFVLDYGEKCISFGAYSDEKLLGIVIFSPTLNIRHMVSLRHIYVKEEYRNLGVAGFMLAESEKKLKISGIKYVSCGYDNFSPAEEDLFARLLENNRYIRIHSNRVMLRYEMSEIMATKFAQSLPKMEKYVGYVVQLKNIPPKDRIRYKERLRIGSVNVTFFDLDEEYTEIYLRDDDIWCIAFSKRKDSGTVEISDYYENIHESGKDKMMFPAMIAKFLMTAQNDPDIRSLILCPSSDKKLKALEDLLGEDHRAGLKQEFIKQL